MLVNVWWITRRRKQFDAKVTALEGKTANAIEQYAIAAQAAGLPERLGIDNHREWVTAEIRERFFAVPDVEKRKAAMRAFQGAWEVARSRDDARRAGFAYFIDSEKSLMRDASIFGSLFVIIPVVWLGHWLGGLLGIALVGAVAGGALSVVESIDRLHRATEEAEAKIELYKQASVQLLPLHICPFSYDELSSGLPEMAQSEEVRRVGAAR